MEKNSTIWWSGRGAALNQLRHPFDLDIDDDGSLFIVDTGNHRIVRWKPNATQGEIIAGGNGRGDRSDHLGRCIARSDDGWRRIPLYIRL